MGTIDPLLVLRAQAGEREALDTLLSQIQQPLIRYLRGLLADQALAEDVLQDVLFRIYRKLVWLREPALFTPWAFRIASRAAFRKLSKLRRLREEPLVEEDFAAPQPVELPEVLEHIETLSPASRAVVVLHYEQGLTLQEVADVLAIPFGTAKSRLAYALRCLRKELR